MGNIEINFDKYRPSFYFKVKYFQFFSSAMNGLFLDPKGINFYAVKRIVPEDKIVVPRQLKGISNKEKIMYDKKTVFLDELSLDIKLIKTRIDEQGFYDKEYMNQQVIEFLGNNPHYVL